MRPHAAFAARLPRHREDDVSGDFVRVGGEASFAEVVHSQRRRDVDLDRERDEVRADHEGERRRQGRAGGDERRELFDLFAGSGKTTGGSDDRLCRGGAADGQRMIDEHRRDDREQALRLGLER